MHYVICYDIENDRLRDRVAKVLEKNGCHRLQKSVFVAPDMAAKDLVMLKEALRRQFQRRPPGPADGVHLFPLGEAQSAEVTHFGHNNILPEILAKRLKILL